MMMKAALTAAVLFACTPYSSLGDTEYHTAPQNLEVLMGGSIQAYHAPKSECHGFMPLAQCANRCTPDRVVDGAEDCTACTLRRFMPPASCAQCSAERPCDTCFTYKLMPINECKIRPEYRSYTPTPSPSVPAYVAPVPTPAPTAAYVPTPAPTTAAKPTSIPTTAPTTPAPVPTTKAPEATTAVPTAAPTTEAPATTEAPKPVYTTTEAPVYTEAPYTEAPKTLIPLPTYAPEGPETDYGTTESPTTGTSAAGNVAGTQSTGSNAATSNESDAESSGLAAGEIAGIVIGCVAAVALVAFVAWKKTQDKQREEQMFGEPAELENPDSNSDYAAM